MVVKAQEDKKNLSSTSLLHTTDTAPAKKIIKTDTIAVKKILLSA